MHNFKDLKIKLSTPKKAVIIPHHKPDADALGSCLGLSNYLRKFGHETQVVSPTDYPEFLHWMPGNDEVLIDQGNQKEACEQAINEADIVFCLDFSALSRIDRLGELVEKRINDIDIVLIDHHRGKEDFADFELWDIDAAATAQLVYEFIEIDSGSQMIDQDIAKCLYAGLITDTGSFKFSSTTSRTLRIAANLKDLGIDTAKIYNLIYDNNSEARLRFMGHALCHNLVFLRDKGVGYFTLSNEERKKFGIKTGDTEGLVNYPLTVSGINISAFFKETEDSKAIRMSFRSIGDFSVAEMASKYFNGGGHKNAAGGKVEGKTMKEVLSLFEKALEEMLMAEDKK